MVVSVRKFNYQIIMLKKICIGFNDILKIGLPWVNWKLLVQPCLFVTPRSFPYSQITVTRKGESGSNGVKS